MLIHLNTRCYAQYKMSSAILRNHLERTSELSVNWIYHSDIFLDVGQTIFTDDVMSRDSDIWQDVCTTTHFSMYTCSSLNYIIYLIYQFTPSISILHVLNLFLFCIKTLRGTFFVSLIMRWIGEGLDFIKILKGFKHQILSVFYKQCCTSNKTMAKKMGWD